MSTCPSGSRGVWATPSSRMSPSAPVAGRRSWARTPAPTAKTKIPTVATSTGTITLQDTRSGSSGVETSIIEPSRTAMIPPMVRAPWLATFTSAIRSTIPKRIRRKPAQLIGRLWKAKKARISEIPPMMPGRITPGLASSKKRPSIPSMRRM